MFLYGKIQIWICQAEGFMSEIKQEHTQKGNKVAEDKRIYSRDAGFFGYACIRYSASIHLPRTREQLLVKASGMMVAKSKYCSIGFIGSII